MGVVPTEDSGLDVCVLSATEAGRLENWSIWPKCKHHRHIKQREAKAGVESGEYRFIGGEGTKVQGPVSMVVPIRVKPWQPVPTAGLMGLRTWGVPRSS